ncbi:MAG: MBL fold metallo-hydrolase [Candidatus Hydrothermarchaeota archaeon]
MLSVDKVVIQTIVDNYIDVFEPSTDKIKRISPGELKEPLVAGHGLSFLIEIERGNQTRKILMDTSHSSHALLHNLKNLGNEVDDIDTIFLSHGHPDHYGGLLGFLNSRNKETPILMHPEGQFPRYIVTPAGVRGPFLFDREKVKEAGGLIVEAKNPVSLDIGVLSTGEIERTTDFEKPWIGPKIVKNHVFQDDYFMDEQALVLNVKNKGLVILVGCAHPGVVNIINHAQKLTGINEIYGIIGGFHLTVAEDEIIEKTVDAFKEKNPSIIIPAHCTGFRAMKKISEKMPEQFFVNCVGTKVFL